MKHGLTHYAIGVRKDLPYETVDTLSYWLNFLMTCTQECPEGNLSVLASNIGTGKECGYVLFPVTSLSKGAVAAIVIGVVVAVLIPALLGHVCRIRRQKRRYKVRFVQQIARNIQIGPSPGDIPPEKLAKEILHIGKGKEKIGKEGSYGRFLILHCVPRGYL